MAVELRYWDAVTFLRFLQDAEGGDVCAAVLQEASNDKIQIVTSALTLAEVIKLKKHKAIPKTDAQKIHAFFQHQYIIVKDVNRYIAEAAQRMVWDNGINPKDAVHVATAVYFHVPQLNTFDKGLLKKTDKIGNPPLKIVVPTLLQTALEFEGAVTDGEAQA
jgi:predicted nucleic acid-binding protein